MRRGWWVPAVLVLGGCGASARLSNLRCDASCQDTDDPLKLTLVLDYTDPDQVLPDGHLAVKVNDSVDETLEGTGLGPLSTQGSLHLAVPLPFGSLSDGETFTVAVQGSTAEGTTNTVTQSFVIHL